MQMQMQMAVVLMSQRLLQNSAVEPETEGGRKRGVCVVGGGRWDDEAEVELIDRNELIRLIR